MGGVGELNVGYNIVSFFLIFQGNDMVCMHWLNYTHYYSIHCIYIIPLNKE